jgi:putative transposase
MRRKPSRRRVSAKLRKDRTDAIRPNQCWSMDFMADELFDGRRLRLLTIVDNFSRVSPFIGVGLRYPGYDVVTALNLAVAQYGVPECLRVDNGPEFISKEVDLWAYAHGVVLNFSRPGKSTDNAFIESFNSRLRQECLNEHRFFLSEAELATFLIITWGRTRRPNKTGKRFLMWSKPSTSSNRFTGKVWDTKKDQNRASWKRSGNDPMRVSTPK